MNSECIEDIVEDDLDNSFDFYKWHHLCFVYGHVMKDGLHLVDLELYLDGLKVNSGNLITRIYFLKCNGIYIHKRRHHFFEIFDPLPPSSSLLPNKLIK